MTSFNIDYLFKGPIFQIQSHSEVPGVKISTYELRVVRRGGGGDTHKSVHKTIPKNLFSLSSGVLLPLLSMYELLGKDDTGFALWTEYKDVKVHSCLSI